MVVFTQYDLLVNAKEFEFRERNPDASLTDMESAGKEVAMTAFRRDCAPLLRRAEKYDAPYVYVSGMSVTKFLWVRLQNTAVNSQYRLRVNDRKTCRNYPPVYQSITTDRRSDGETPRLLSQAVSRPVLQQTY